MSPPTSTSMYGFGRVELLGVVSGSWILRASTTRIFTKYDCAISLKNNDRGASLDLTKVA